MTVSNLNISSVNNFNQVINNNGGDQDYVLAGTGRSSGLTDYQVLSAQYPTEVTDLRMVNNYEAMANKDPATLTGWKKEFGVIDFVETQTEEEGEFHASNGVMAPYFAAVSDRRLRTSNPSRKPWRNCASSRATGTSWQRLGGKTARG